MDRGVSRWGVWLGVVLLACGLVVTCVAVLAGTPAPRPRSAAAPSMSASAPLSTVGSTAPMGARATLDPRAALRWWDQQRAAAWVAADPGALADLYTTGSVAGRRDVRLLRRWVGRAVRVTELEPQVLAVHVVRAEPALLVLRVTDRLAVLSAELHGRPVALPRDQVSTRRVVLQRNDSEARWRVASVTGVATPLDLIG